MKKSIWLVLLLAVFFLVAATFSQEAQKKMPRSTACESDTCIYKVLSSPTFETAHDLQDIVNTIRQVVDIWRISSNSSEHNISLQGTREQIAVAERLVSVLENLKLSGGKEKASVLVYQPDPSVAQTRVSETVQNSSGTPVQWTHCELTTCFIKALYVPDYSIKQMQEVVNSLRSKQQVQRINIVVSSHAIVFQGTSEQIAAAEKLLLE